MDSGAENVGSIVGVVRGDETDEELVFFVAGVVTLDEGVFGCSPGEVALGVVVGDKAELGLLVVTSVVNIGGCIELWGKLGDEMIVSGR